MAPLLRFALVLSLFVSVAPAREATRSAASPYQAERNARFAAWPQAQQRGEQPGQIWECAACPIMDVMPGGSGVFIGAYEWEAGPNSNEGPPVEVKIPDMFAVGRHEVTRGEFAAFAAATHRRPRGKCVAAPGTKATFLDPGFEQTDDHPVVCVSFDDARAYVQWLNSRTSGGYRLLTEAEWEYVTRASSHDVYAWGNSPWNACLYANFAVPAGTGPACPDTWPRTAPVGQAIYNSHNLFDTIGNAAEWVDGCFVAGKQPASLDRNCKQHIEKGGSWKSRAEDLRPARRIGHDANYREDSLGFRVAKTLPDSTGPLDSAAAYQQRGRLRSWLGDYEGARADFDQALKLEPANATLLAERAEASYWLRDKERLPQDVAAALAANADEPLALTLESSLMLSERKDVESARAKVERAATATPWRAFTIATLARARYASRDLDGALAASGAALQLVPRYPEMHRLQMQILGIRRDWRAMFNVTRRYAATNYFNSAVQSDTALALYRIGLRDVALANMKVALHLDASATNYLIMESIRARDDLEGRRADIQDALKVDPASDHALYAMAGLEADSGNHAAAVDAYTQYLGKKLDAREIPGARLKRGIEYSKLGKARLADDDFAAAIEPADDPVRLNNLCWELTVAGIELERAARACKRSLELKPQSPATLDSWAWLLLRQGRFEEAIVAFDAALAASPKQGASLYGRGLARQQKCGCRDGLDDLNAALVQSPVAPDELSFTGFSPRGSLTPPWSEGPFSPAVP